MKDCSYTPSKGEAVPIKSEEEGPMYPRFSLYGNEAVEAVFGDSKLKAGSTIRITADMKVTRLTETDEGPEEVTVEIVAVGGKPTEVESDGEDEED